MTPFQLFVSLYAMYNGLDPQVFDGKFNADSVKTWNSTMNAISKKTRITTKMYKEMFYFAYVHNPLNTSLSLYGATNTYYRVASKYKAWREQHAHDIDIKGFQRVLFDTKPGGLTDLDKELLADFE